MKFGTIPIAAADGALLAHSVRLPDLTLSKGRRLTADDLRALAARSIREITVAQLDAGDIGEDVAATRAAARLAGAGIVATKAHTGRVNLQADAHGLARLDPTAIDA